MKIDLKVWIPIVLTIIMMVSGAGVAYGQFSSEVKTLKSEIETVKETSEKEKEKIDQKLDTANKTINDMKTQQATMKVMMEMLLQHQGIPVPVPPSVGTDG
jgi:Sec-independent protein translocase protein TatA